MFTLGSFALARLQNEKMVVSEGMYFLLRLLKAVRLKFECVNVCMNGCGCGLVVAGWLGPVARG